MALIQESVRLLHDNCVSVKSKLVRTKHQPWFNDEIRTLTDRRDIAYRRWKRFRTDELKAVLKSARSEVTKRIKIEKKNVILRQEVRFRIG